MFGEEFVESGVWCDPCLEDAIGEGLEVDVKQFFAGDFADAAAAGGAIDFEEDICRFPKDQLSRILSFDPVKRRVIKFAADDVGHVGEEVCLQYLAGQMPIVAEASRGVSVREDMFHVIATWDPPFAELPLASGVSVEPGGVTDVTEGFA